MCQLLACDSIPVMLIAQHAIMLLPLGLYY